MDFRQHHLRLLPAVDKILQENILAEIKTAVPRNLVVEAVQDVITERRFLILEAFSKDELELLDISPPVLARDALKKIQEKMEASLQPVLNATGVI
ncbi:MAG: hypothetical protein Q7J85_02735, partial [Bacillota bacterium]|nr:hypothetical protein [Bacillota bacterium]